VGDWLDEVITHHFSSTQIEDDWKLQMTGLCGKGTVHPNE
jgi:hypothetical protein